MTAITRAATAADLDEIMAIERASFPSDAWSERMMRETLETPSAAFRVADRDDHVLGYAAMLAPRASDADVLTIAVTDSERGTGLGRRLLRDLIALAADRRAHHVFLEVRDDNDVAQSLYASEGFVAVGRRPRYYQPDDVDAIVMRLDLTRAHRSAPE